MAYAKINSITNANMAKVSNVAKAAIGKIASIEAPSSCAAPVCDGLVGWFKAGEGITTDTTGGTTTVSSWANQAPGETWAISQGTKADQPIYDATNDLIEMDGENSLDGIGGYMQWDENWSVVLISDVSDNSWGHFFQHNDSYFSRWWINDNDGQWQIWHNYRGNYFKIPWDSGADYDTATGDSFDIFGVVFPGVEISAGSDPPGNDNLGRIHGQYLFTCDPHEDGLDTYTQTQSGNPINRIGTRDGNDQGAIMKIKEVMFFDKQLNQTEVTAIYDYADTIVTLHEFTIS